MPIDAATLQNLLEGCLRDRMRAKPYAVDIADLRRCFGLEPLPPKTALAVETIATEPGPGCEIRTVTFESRPGVRLPATAYVPSNAGPHTLVVLAADTWLDGRNAPWMQAMGITLATQGLLAVAIDPPGTCDRLGMGDPDDPTLAASAPSIGVFAWDVVRTADFAVEHLSALGERYAVVGVGMGGSTALATAALDPRVAAAVASGAGHSQEPRMDHAYAGLPGVADLGDWVNLLAHRQQLPIHFLATEDDDPERMELTVKKLRGVYGKTGQARIRIDRFLGGRDLNRRMREAAVAFLLEHLAGSAARAYVPEPLPMTDGLANPAPANTISPVLLAHPVSTSTLAEIAAEALAAPYPEQEPDLVPWAKYGRIEPLPEVETLKLVDRGESPNVIVVPAIDHRLLIPLGMTQADVAAQILHLLLPGSPEGWEGLALQGDALTAMIASVRTLIKGAETKEPPKRVEAEGPVSSLAARLLALLRPTLEVQATHWANSWQDCAEQGILVPGARYRKWPFPAVQVSPSKVEPETIDETAGLDQELDDVPVSTSDEILDAAVPSLDVVPPEQQ